MYKNSDFLINNATSDKIDLKNTDEDAWVIKDIFHKKEAERQPITARASLM